MFWKRLISGIILLAASFLLFCLGGGWLLAALAVLAVCGLYELMRVFQMERHPLAIVVYVGTLAYFLMFLLQELIWCFSDVWSFFVLVLVFITLLTFFVFRFPKDSFHQIAQCVFAFLYVTMLFGYIYQTRCLEQGKWLVWLILIGSWGSDTCAYVVGVLIGKHHFSELSPNKTVEGCIGGVFGAAFLGFLFALLFPDEGYMVLPAAIVFPIIGAVCALVSQVGDLAASAIKRNYKVKDYGTAIPGHGGILDRYDSVLFAAPFVYYLLILFASISVYVS